MQGIVGGEGARGWAVASDCVTKERQPGDRRRFATGRQVGDPQQVVAEHDPVGVQPDRALRADRARRSQFRPPPLGEAIGVFVGELGVEALGGVDGGGEARRGCLHLDRAGAQTGGRVDVDAGSRLVAERVFAVVLGAPHGFGVAVDHVGHLRRMFGFVAIGVVVVRGGLFQGDRREARFGVHVGGHAAVGVAGDQRQRERDQTAEQRQRDQPASRVAHPPRQPPASRRGQRAQHRGDLPGGLPRARGLDREHLLEVGQQRGDVGVAAGEILGGGAFHDGRGRGRHLRAAELHVGDLLAHVAHRHGDRGWNR